MRACNMLIAGQRMADQDCVRCIGVEGAVCFINLIAAPFGLFEKTTTSTAANPSLRNWDPRVGLAFDPFKDHKTSIRASFGMFHNVGCRVT